MFTWADIYWLNPIINRSVNRYIVGGYTIKHRYINIKGILS